MRDRVVVQEFVEKVSQVIFRFEGREGAEPELPSESGLMGH